MASSLIDQRLLNLLSAITSLLFNLSLIILLMVIFYYAIKYIVGNEKEIKSLNDKILFILLGVAIVFFSIIIPKLVRLFFNPR